MLLLLARASLYHLLPLQSEKSFFFFPPQKTSLQHIHFPQMSSWSPDQWIYPKFQFSLLTLTIASCLLAHSISALISQMHSIHSFRYATINPCIFSGRTQWVYFCSGPTTTLSNFCIPGLIWIRRPHECTSDTLNLILEIWDLQTENLFLGAEKNSRPTGMLKWLPFSLIHSI